ncbi:MAG: metallophosphoesterase [Lentisphaeraceae bacterium]|nr:metallophosphoesterase [Lentisphaeraceae bacterium]
MSRLDSYSKLEQRLAIQQKMASKTKVKGSGFENLSFLHTILRKGLKTFSLDQKGLENVLDVQIIEKDMYLPRLAKSWQGKRILHLSDTHLDGIPGFVEILKEKISQLTYDLCVWTGDFRFGKGAYHEASMQPTIELLQSLSCEYGIYGVLGNHDFLDEVELLEKHGMQILMNESIDLGDGLHLCGVDDPHLYRCDDIEKAVQGIPKEALKVLLIHSPEKVEEAQANGIDYYLCGHTHGGQISLPLIGRPFSNARCKRKFAFGEFEYKGMKGYTHNGTGASSVAARFGCPSEIVIFNLKSS